MVYSKLKIKILLTGALFSLFFALVPGMVSAATVYLSASSPSISVGDTIVVNVMMDPSGQNPNVVEGNILLKSGDGNIKIAGLSTAGSVLAYWPQAPSLINNSEISFTGGKPNGFDKPEVLFKIILSGQSEGQAILSPDSINAYNNDADATPIGISDKDLTIDIGSAKSTLPENQWLKIVSEDKTPPQQLSAVVGQDDSLFGGKKFLAISAVDNESGIDHYSVKEGDWPEITSQGTYILRDQQEQSEIIVTAWDKAGNHSQITLVPVKSAANYLAVGAIVLAVILILLCALYIVNRKRLKKISGKKRAVKTNFTGKFVVIFFIAVGIFFAGTSHAATLYLEPSVANVAVGNLFTVKLFVDTEGVAINNAESVIQFPKDSVSAVSVDSTASIFSLWVAQPSFSNTSGSVSFNGGVPNPGYTGKDGEVLSVTFMAEKAGTVTFLLSNSSVLANDGLGTDVLSSQLPANVTISPAASSQPVNLAQLLPAPVISSSVYSDQNSWYSAKAGIIAWTLPAGATSVQTYFNTNPNTAPSINYTPPIFQKEVKNLTDGIWYFHLRYAIGNKLSEIANYKIQIDSQPPSALTATPVKNSDGTFSLNLSATDSLSGIDYYNIAIDDQPAIKFSALVAQNPVLLPKLGIGDHQILVSVYDKAGNEKDLTTKITVDSSTVPVTAPVIVSHTKNINSGLAWPVFPSLMFVLIIAGALIMILVALFGWYRYFVLRRRLKLMEGKKIHKKILALEKLQKENGSKREEKEVLRDIKEMIEEIENTKKAGF